MEVEYSFLLLMLVLSIRGQEDEGYSYEGENGPDNWPQMYDACGGDNQSPININFRDLVMVHEQPLQWSNYDQVPETMQLENNGHTVRLTVPNPDPPYALTGGVLNGVYTFYDLHFHWGETNTNGSEHTFSMKSSALEGHAVHYKMEYGSFDNALNYKDGVVVVGYFYDVSAPNSDIEYLTSEFEKIRIAHTTISIEPRPLSTFVKELNYLYLNYNGSLTTPPCTEVVTWLLYPFPFNIGGSQMEEFRMLQESNGDPIKRNIRPVQPLNGRSVNVVT